MTNPNYVITAFEEPGLWISAPPDVTVTFGPITPTPEMLAGQPDFQPIRVLGNLKLTSKNDARKTRFTFQQAAHLQVRYSTDDETRASQRSKRLAVAWWDGQKWVRLTEGSTRLAPGIPLQGGMRYFDISEIDDPPISWGT